MKNKFFNYVLIVIGFTTVSLQAKLYVPQTDEQFYRELSRHTLAVVHFNPYPVESTEYKLQRMKDAFMAVATMDRYKDADVAFIGVNLNIVPELAEDFNIDMPVIIPADDELDEDIDDEDDEQRADDQKDAEGPEEKSIQDIQPEEQAVVMLFRDGKPLTDGSKTVRKTGFMTKVQLQDFVNKYFGSTIDQKLAQYKTQERTRLQARYVAPKRRLVKRVYYTDDYDYRPVYRGYYREPSWRRWGYYGSPYGYWPGFGTGFGFGGRRGGFSFGFGW